MTTKTVLVDQIVLVTVDETKFTPEFMADFRRSMYPFKSIDDHVEHLAQMYARGLYDEFSTFVEGYGHPKEMGIEVKLISCIPEVAPSPAAAA